MDDEYILKVSKFLKGLNEPLYKAPDDFPIIEQADYLNDKCLKDAVSYASKKIDEMRMKEALGIDASDDLILLDINIVRYYAEPIIKQNDKKGKELLKLIIETKIQPLFVHQLIDHWEEIPEQQVRYIMINSDEYFIEMSEFLNKFHKESDFGSVVEKPVNFPVYSEWKETIETNFSEFMLYIKDSIVLLFQKIWDNLNYVEEELFSWHYYIMKDYAKIILENGTAEDKEILELCARQYIEPYFMKIIMYEADKNSNELKNKENSELKRVDSDINKDFIPYEEKAKVSKPKDYLKNYQGKNELHNNIPFISTMVCMVYTMLHILIHFKSDNLTKLFGDSYIFPFTELLVVLGGAGIGFVVGLLIKKFVDK